MGINNTPEYKWIIGIVVVAAIIFFAAQIFSSDTSGDLVDENFIEYSVLAVGDYTYSLTSNTPSHSCPTGWESVRFNLGGKEFRIYSVDANPIEEHSPGISDDPECQSQGTPLSLKDYCGREQTGTDDLSRPIYSYICTGNISFEILDSEKVDACMVEDSCELLNGVDVELQPFCLDARKLFDNEGDALIYARKIGCSGYHMHEGYEKPYMACEDHQQPLNEDIVC